MWAALAPCVSPYDNSTIKVLQRLMWYTEVIAVSIQGSPPVLLDVLERFGPERTLLKINSLTTTLPDLCYIHMIATTALRVGGIWWIANRYINIWSLNREFNTHSPVWDKLGISRKGNSDPIQAQWKQTQYLSEAHGIRLPHPSQKGSHFNDRSDIPKRETIRRSSVRNMISNLTLKKFM